jgi:hypothetical protein
VKEDETMAKIFGYCPGNKQTNKAVFVTVIEVDGEGFRADTEWLPRSIAADLEVRRVVEDGVAGYEVRATVPDWWLKKLDTRAAWQHRGMSSPPMAQRPW